MRAANQRNIDFMENSTLISGKVGRIKKKKENKGEKKEKEPEKEKEAPKKGDE